MSYTPTNWVNGDIITAEKLNKMEQGIAANTMVVTANTDPNTRITGPFDATWQQIYDALKAGVSVVCYVEFDTNNLIVYTPTVMQYIDNLNGLTGYAIFNTYNIDQTSPFALSETTTGTLSFLD